VITVDGPDGVRELATRELPPSSWVEVTQERIDAFADATLDRQSIHVDRAAAAAGPFGTTVAHGFLTLSLVVALWNEVVRVEGGGVTINYGLDRVRFPAPVPAGSRVRARFVVGEVTDVAGGVQASIASTIERDGGERPVCVAQLLLRFLA
jgi:acyl dehydratase